jgi:hypothetical protein
MASDKVRVTVPRRAEAPRGAAWAANFVVCLWRLSRPVRAATKAQP